MRPRAAEIAGTIVFCFQPGEEGHAGAKLMIEDGALENPHVDRTFALHLYSGLDVGKVGIRDGAFFASSDRFDIELIGSGGHGAMPQNAVDPVVAAAQFVTMVQTVASREFAASEPVVVTVGSLHAGTTFNVIPDRATLQGSVRALRRAACAERSASAWNGCSRGLCEAMRLEYTLRVPLGLSADRERSGRPTTSCATVAREVVGPENVVDPHEIVMWSEDMSFMQELRPGAYFLIGARGARKRRSSRSTARASTSTSARSRSASR